MQRTILKKIFNINNQSWFSSNKRNDSYANVDIVVNPPMMPIVIKSLISGEMFFPSVMEYITKPIIRLPAILTANVPNGKEGIILLRYFEIRYLETAPINPPAPM